MPAVSPPPEGSTTDFPFFFLEICFSLWFRSDALSVSPEPELQIHCVFQSFLFLFSNVLVFPWKVKFFLVRKEKVFFLEVYAGYIYTHIYLSICLCLSVCLSIYLSIYLYPCTSNAQYCDFHPTLNIVPHMQRSKM